MSKKLMIVGLLIAVCYFSTPVYATLDVYAPTAGSFTSVTLNGTAQTTTADFTADLTASDSTGTGNGWHVTVSASQFTDEASNTLPLSSLTLAQPSSITETTGSGSASPTIQGTPPWVIDSGTAVTILSAAVGDGMGSYDVTFPTGALTLSIDPATTYIDTVDNSSTYSTTITWSIVSGP